MDSGYYDMNGKFHPLAQFRGIDAHPAKHAER